MNKIYTKRGDAGRTSLFDGTDVPKSEPRVAAYGDVDEFNAALGVARAFVEDKDVAAALLGIQKDLFAIGAQLADPGYDPAKRTKKTRITEERVVEFERMIDRWDEELPPLRHFVVPGGGKGGALLHLVRTTCRRAERSIVALSAGVPVSPVIIKYMNRLSDLLFVMARVENARHGEQTIEW
ncbi:MAG: cob(I)yrinic acid a,c-diamide adenosyltransferase [Planctomycetes bacterium]|nr:cob(I)yrinic acid a,c-diamide adenosyltransferase [Planctomycetota bacterium]